MKNLSLRLDDIIFSESENILKEVKISRNQYINEAIDNYNKLCQRKILEKKFKKASKLVREDSMQVLKDFEAIEYED